MGSRRWACSRRMDDIAEGSGLFVTSCLESTWRAGGLGVGGLFPGDQPRHELSAAAGDETGGQLFRLSTVSDACLLQQRTPRGQALRPWSELLFFPLLGVRSLPFKSCNTRSPLVPSLLPFDLPSSPRGGNPSGSVPISLLGFFCCSCNNLRSSTFS
jgi:hypothetical protein